ncbi:cilia- and flagella-associated protein 251-like [Ciona intestinalis]
MACSEDKRWVATGDKGPGSCVILWDTYTGIPVQTIFGIHDESGVVAIAMSTDAKYIVTVSATSPQTVSIWDWTESADQPMFSTEINPRWNLQTFVAFHPDDNQQFVTNSDSQVVFYSWESGTLKHHAPFLSDSVFNRAIGLFSQTVFQTTPSGRALTATSLGNIVVWNPERGNGRKGGMVGSHQKRALKLVRVKDRALTCITCTDDLIVTGDTLGHVRFYDNQLNLVNWYQNLKIGVVTGVSFQYNPDFRLDRIPEINKYPEDATIQAKTFAVNDFIVSTKSAEVVHVEADGSKVTNIFKEHDSAVHAIAASPTKPWICIGSYSGILKVWDYSTKEVVVTRLFQNKARIQCIAYSHNGLQLAVGMTTGMVVILDAISLDEEVTFHYACDVITHCLFSHNSRYLATADGHHTTTVFIFDSNNEWKYLGRYKAHYDIIQDLSFGIDLDSNQPRLLTLGKDRVLVEYDLQGSSKDDLRLLSVERIEQSALPLCITWYPPVTKESFLVVGNDQYKMKLFNTTTKMCRKTLLGPTYGSPAKLMSIVPTTPSRDPSEHRLLTYATSDKIGLQLLPLDGNPHRSASMIAHPSGVSRLACSNDGGFVFTAGGVDSTVHMWSVNAKSLSSVAALGGEGLIPFYGLLEGGREGEMFGELENYFYFAQLRSQGINTTDERETSSVVQLDQVPFLMRALGFYPSEQEIEDMLNEVKFSKYVDSGEYVTNINLADFIKLYVNHRPAFGLSPDEIRKAFSVLATRTDDTEASVDRSTLLSVLQRKGEHMTEHELAECLTTLLGFNPEGGFDADDVINYDTVNKDLEDSLPEFVTADIFANEMLGLHLYDATH